MGNSPGGRGIWSDSISTVSYALEQDYRGRPVVAMDWGLVRSIEFLTKVRLRVREGCEFAAEPSPRYLDLCRAVLREQNAVYLVGAPHGSSFPRCWEACRQVAHDAGLDFVLEQTFYERDGTANTFLFSLKSPHGAAPT